MDYALNSPKHTQRTNKYIPTHTICHTVCGLCDLPAIPSLMLNQTPSQSYWHVWEIETEYYHIHCFLDSNQWTVVAYSQFIAFFVLQQQIFCYLSCCWGACDLDNQICTVCAGVLSSPLPLCHLWQLNWRSASIVSHSSCPSPRVREAPGGQPAHSAVYLPAHKHPIINNDLKPHDICCMKDVDFIGKTRLLWVMVHFVWALWWRPRTITHIDGIHFICEENTANITHKNGPHAWVSQRPGWKKACVFAPQQQVDECIDCHREQQSTTSSMGPVDIRVCTENKNLKLLFRTYGHRSHHGVLHLDEGPERALFNTITVSPYCGVSSGSAAP